MKKSRLSVLKTLVFLATTLSGQFASAKESPNSPRGAQNPRYPLKDVYQKLVNNRGDGFENLYGVRNFRFVMQGAVYRGGANNSYRKNPSENRSNMNPLQTSALVNLCEEGFTNVVYMYTQNFESAPKQVTCTRYDGKANHKLNYQQLSPLNDSGLKAILSLVRDHLVNPANGPLYIHCWNGWHASGLASAASLVQFCGLSKEAALSYWNKNTDGNNGARYDGIRKRLKDFQIISDLGIPEEVKNRYCPNLNGQMPLFKEF